MSSSAGGWILGPGDSLEVDRDTVLPAIQFLLDEAKAFTQYAAGQLEALRVEAPVGDPASVAMARGLNTVLWEDSESFYARCWAYATELVQLAEACAEAAREYGHAESEIEAMFSGARLPEVDGALWAARSRVGGRQDGDHCVV